MCPLINIALSHPLKHNVWDDCVALQHEKVSLHEIMIHLSSFLFCIFKFEVWELGLRGFVTVQYNDQLVFFFPKKEKTEEVHYIFSLQSPPSLPLTSLVISVGWSVLNSRYPTVKIHGPAVFEDRTLVYLFHLSFFSSTLFFFSHLLFLLHFLLIHLPLLSFSSSYIPPLPPTSSISPLGACPLLSAVWWMNTYGSSEKGWYTAWKERVEGRKKWGKKVWDEVCFQTQAMEMHTHTHLIACMCPCARAHKFLLRHVAKILTANWEQESPPLSLFHS